MDRDPLGLILPRLVELIGQAPDREAAPQPPQLLSAYRDAFAYVLLGDPGIGKSTAFAHEAALTGGVLVRARDFAAGLARLEPELQRVVFIDGLDETRAGAQDGRSVLDLVRGELIRLRLPRFRLSCRSADWLGSSDLAALTGLLPTGTDLHVLQLQALSTEDVDVLLRNVHNVLDPSVFRGKAQRLGLGSLLGNPQTLGMLAKAVRDGGRWPHSRTEAFEKACFRLAGESNVEHAAAKRKQWPSVQDIMQAAGALCTLYLCADLSTISIDTTDAPANAVVRSLGPPISRLPLLQALETTLFTAVDEGLFAPIHRNVAEYLAAKFLGSIAGTAAATGAVARLMTSADRRSVSSLRGLLGWSATLSPILRQRLIRDDPGAVLLYGDMGDFPASDKRLLLTHVRDQASELLARSSLWREDARMDGLLAPDMLPTVAKILRDTDRTDPSQLVVSLILQALASEGEHPDLKAELVELVRDDTRWPRIRYAALQVLSEDADNPLVPCQLLVDVGSDEIADPDDEVAGRLLTHLFPQYISAAEALTFYHRPRNNRLIGTFHMFWAHRMPKNCPKAELDRLMQALGSRFQENERHDHIVGGLISSAIERALPELGDQVSDSTLHDWLQLGLGGYGHSVLEHDAKQVVRNWFLDRPTRCLGVLGEALQREEKVWDAEATLHGAPPPSGIGRWWLVAADRLDGSAKKRDCFFRALRLLQQDQPDGGLSLDEIMDWAESRPFFRQLLGDALVCSWPPEHYEYHREDALYRRKWENLEAQRLEKRRKALSAAPQEVTSKVLCELGTAWFSLNSGDDQESTGAGRVLKKLGGDSAMLEHAIRAFEMALHRADVPDESAILQSAVNGQQWNLSYPFLVGMELATEKGLLMSLSDDVLRRAVMFHLTTLVGRDPEWLMQLAQSRPDLFANVYRQYALAYVQAGRSLYGLNLFDERPEFRGIGTRVLPEVLSAYPGRLQRQKLEGYWALLRSLESCIGSDIVNVALSELSRPDLNANSCLSLRCAVLTYSDGHVPVLNQLIGHSRGRATRVAAFFSAYGRQLSPQVSKFLVSAIGRVAPARAGDLDWHDDRHGPRSLVIRQIEDLSSRPESEVTKALQDLLVDDSVRSWHPRILRALASQRIVAREASHAFLSVEQVCSVVGGGVVPDPRVIFELVVEELELLVDEVASGDLDVYTQFWNVDGWSRPKQPKPEEACRDLLVLLLRTRLARYGIACDTETRHAGRKRSDAWCFFKGAGVPIEAKRQDNREVWTAIEAQLVPRYTGDPRAGERGIYVVFWFGTNVPRSPYEDGVVPATARQMRDILHNSLDERLKGRISIHVLDLSQRKGTAISQRKIPTRTARIRGAA